MDVTVIRSWLTGTLGGRALILGVAIKIVVLVIRALGESSSLVEAVDAAGSLSLVVAAIALSIRLFSKTKRIVLWRVRHKLLLSYVFIGFVPALLLIGFFAVCGLLLFFNVGAYLMRSRLQTLAEEARFLAQTVTLELETVRSEAEFQQVLNRRQRAASARYPFASYAIVPTDRKCKAPATAAPDDSAAPSALVAGPWAHVEAPVSLPTWVSCDGLASLFAYAQAESPQSELGVRAAALPATNVARYAVVVDLPVGDTLRRQLRTDTGVQLSQIVAIDETDGDVAPVEGRAVDAHSPEDMSITLAAGPLNVVISEEARGELRWTTLLDYTDWNSGETGTVAVNFQVNPLDTYQRISTASIARVGNLSFGQIFLILLALIATLFLIIQSVAVIMGLTLARSITGSVHELFAGTERVRRGDFTHKIAIRSRDQLGDLAESFNSMTASIEELLQQKAEKERLEQELKIARGIQMSLLPQGPLTVPGVALTGYCEPAREVGGDYYDFLQLDERRLGILIADVAGKGASAAFYMAELKGIVLSLSGLHTSPRQLLIDANRIISRHLDSRSFITMTYAVIDLEARTLTHARAGHCPLIYLPGPGAASRRAEVLMPDGLVLGLHIDDGELFNRLLVEESRPLCPGDLFVLYTDGVTEAMNAHGDLFGESRLTEAVQTYGPGPFDRLRERILQEIHTFVAGAPQQDDLTMVLFKVDERGDLPVEAGSRT